MKEKEIVERVIRKLDYKNRITLTPKMVQNTGVFTENEVEVTLYSDGLIVIKKERDKR